MRIAIPIAITLFSVQCFVVAYKRNHEHKRKDKNLQKVKYQKHRDESLLYGAMKEFEDSSQATEHHLESKQTQVIPNTETSRNTTQHHSKRPVPFSKVRDADKRNASDHGMTKEKATISHNTLIQSRDSKEKPPFANKLSTTTSAKRKDLSVKSRDEEISSSIKKHKIPSGNLHYRHTRTRKRTKVEEALDKERQNIATTIDSLDDLPGSFSKAADMDGMDITEVNVIDNNTLADYFHSLNDNSSENNINNNNNDNDVSLYTPTSSSSTSKSTWDESSPSSSSTSKSTWDESSLSSPPTSKSTWDDSSPSYTEESNSGNDDFYDAIDNGDKPPPVKIKRVRPTKSHFHKSMSKSTTVSSSMRQNQGSETQTHTFRKPSQEDFENFFRGMLDHFGHGRGPDQAIKQGKTYEVNHQETHDNNNNVTAFLDGHDGLPHGNMNKFVSLGSPERVDAAHQMPQHNMDPAADTNPLFFKIKETGRDGEEEGMASFLPPDTPNAWTERPFGNNMSPPSKQLSSQERPSNNFGHLPFTARMPLVQQVTQGDPTIAIPQDAISSPKPLKGTHIMGGKISGGQISGGLIQGGQIKAGLIEGGVIKGGQVVGGHIINGTMDGGVIVNGKMLGGHFMNGRIEGGQLIGGNVFGGKILGGSVEGGDLKGGVVAGGRFRGGSMQGGLLKGGEIQGGTVKGGKVEGGILHGGNIEGGELKFGDISGGTLKSGAMLGGMLKNGSIEGGTLKGGIIEGGVLKGGVMEGGQLKGGLVLAGKIKGGIIEGGVIEGGEIGDGVLITGGKVNATIIGTGSSMDKNRRLGGLFKQGVNPQGLGLKVDQQKYLHGSHNIQHASKVMSDLLPSPQAPISTPQLNSGLKVVNPNSNVKIPLREGVLKMLPKERDSSDDDDLEKLLSEGESENKKTPEPELSSQRFFEEQEQPSRVVQKKGGKHHVVFDGVGFDLPNEDFVDLIDKIRNEDLIHYYNKNQDTKKDLKFGQRSKPTESVTLSEKKIEHIKPEDLEKKLSFPTKPRSSVTHKDKDKSDPGDMEEVPASKPSGVKFGKMRAVTLNQNDTERLRPTYHWSLNKLIKDRIPGSPGPAIRTHGELKSIRGGLQLNGHDAWLGAGDFSGGCISDPDTCEDGLSFEMTFRLDKDALKYTDMNYIVDSGASTFNSKGFSLYTVHGNLRADLAIANQEFCLQIPLTVRKWQDVLVTWKKSEGIKMYINCELKAQSKGNEHCIGCHSKGCHVTDTNTLLMIGRPNYSPHFHCTKFDSGDISFWEKYLSAKDVETLCGAPTGELEKSSASISHSTPPVLQEISQLKFPQPTVNQPAFLANPLHSYLANQRYFNRFTGKSAEMLSYQRPPALLPRFQSRKFLSKQVNSYHRYVPLSDVSNWGKKDNRKSLTLIHTKEQLEKPSSRQLGNHKMFPVSASGVMPSSVMKNILVGLKLYKGARLRIFHHNSFFLHKLFSYAKSHSLSQNAENTNELQNENKILLGRPLSSASYFKPAVQSRGLTNPISPYINKEYYVNRDNFRANEISASRGKQQSYALGGLGGPYKNQNIMVSRSTNGFLKASSVPYNNVRVSQATYGQAQAFSHSYSHLTPQVTSGSTNSFRITLKSPPRPATSGSQIANTVGFLSSLNKQFYPRLFPWGKGGRTVPPADKVVTEGELKEKGLLIDILSRNHIHHNKRVKISQ